MFSMYHVDIRCIPPNLIKLQYYIEELSYNLSIIAISESWLQEFNKTLFNLKGYIHEYVLREHRTGGGVSLFIARSLNNKVQNDLFIDLLDINTLVIGIHKTEQSLILYLIY